MSVINVRIPEELNERITALHKGLVRSSGSLAPTRSKLICRLVEVGLENIDSPAPALTATRSKKKQAAAPRASVNDTFDVYKPIIAKPPTNNEHDDVPVWRPGDPLN